MRKLDSLQKAELVEFLEGLYSAAGYTTQKRWAEEGGYHATNLSTAMNRSVPDGIDGYTLLKLIRAAAARVTAAPDELALRLSREEASAREADRDLGRRLATIEAQVRELPTADDLKLAVATLEAAIRRQAGGDTGEVRTGKSA